MIPLKESIYAGWTIFDGMILGRKKAASSPLALSPLIKIKDEVIGVDKLEHLFGKDISPAHIYPFLKTLQGFLPKFHLQVHLW